MMCQKWMMAVIREQGRGRDRDSNRLIVCLVIWEREMSHWDGEWMSGCGWGTCLPCLMMREDAVPMRTCQE